MKKSFSPYWNRLVLRAIRERKPELLRCGRAMEMITMSLVLNPPSVQWAWAAGAWGDLGYLAEWMQAGVDADLAKTDPALFSNLTQGLAEIRRLGWDRKLGAVQLHRMEDLLQSTIANQKVEGYELSAEEVAEVRQRLAREFENAEILLEAGNLREKRGN